MVAIIYNNVESCSIFEIFVHKNVSDDVALHLVYNVETELHQII